LDGVPINGLNRAVTSFAGGASNVALVDWHGAVTDDPGMLIDGVHADAEGYALRANLFADALSSCGSPDSLEHVSGGLPPAASAGRQEEGKDAPPEGPTMRERRVAGVAQAIARAVGTGSEFG
jgi:hypothetical protein